MECTRKHYDGTGLEEFDLTPYREKLKNIYENVYKYEDGDDASEIRLTEFLEQHYGFIYFNADLPDDDNDYRWCINNDGSNMHLFGYENDELIQINSAYAYSKHNLDEYLQVGYSIITCSAPTDKDVISKEFVTFSNIVYDGKYIYFAEEPVNYNADDKNAYIYRAKPTGSELKKIYKKAYNPGANPEILYDPDWWDEFECDSRFIEMIGCDKNNLYFYCCEMENNEPIFNFYKMSTQKKNAVPQKIFSYKFYEIMEIEYSNGHFYFKLYEKLDDCYKELYCCMKSDGTCLTKQDTPFEWRY